MEFERKPSVSEKSTEPERVLSSSPIFEQTAFQNASQASSSPTNNGMGVEVPECMYIFFFNPIELETAVKK